ncbi:MAG: MotA/TolQ/ExbB proton channel family protein [Pirellulales bacterium]|nr:MotA/TolQ/ExbB proton channel family protein [Pirellulales bacterium]
MTIDSQSSQTDSPYSDRPPETAGNSLVSTTLGVAFSAGFYLLAWSIPWAPMQRYFLGHPIAVAATVLFWFAVAVLLGKWLAVADQSSRLAAIRDDDLLPSEGEASPANQWLRENDAGHVAKNWLRDLTRLPSATRSSHLVRRLEELLTRQSQRGSAKHLADDLRELSGRDADVAHDSLGLVRIIVWAIPMLGFLGTVIGITQTLGGLDFSNGTAAVENLKSGLYVAFDTTALGLVLSVVAIFLQFPVERNEQRLLASIDARVGHLVSACLPSDEASDNQTVLIAELCKGVQAAVAESLENQARLWRQTIDEAQGQWQAAHDTNTNLLAEAFEVTLVPALVQHAEAIAQSSQSASQQLSTECEKWQSTLDHAFEKLQAENASTSHSLVDAVDHLFKPALRQHADKLERSSQIAADRLEDTWEQWQQAMDVHSVTLTSQQQTLLRQYELLNETHQQGDAIAEVGQALETNLARLNETNQAIDRSINAAAGHGMADAMRILARAVDALSARLAEDSAQQSSRAKTKTPRSRQAA